MYNKSRTILLLPVLLLIVPGMLRGMEESRSPKVGLVLSGGGARGAAHIGVLKILERERIPIHCIAGTSFGALVGGLHALGYSASELEEIFMQDDWDAFVTDKPDRRLSPMMERRNYRYQGQINFKGFSPELPSGLWSGQQVIEILISLTTERMVAAEYDFDKLPIPFRAVATDLVSGEEFVFKQGRMTEALRASIAVPFLFTPVDKDEMLLVDGGLVNNLPTDIARDMGADIVIAVDVTSPLLKKEQIRSFVEVLDQSISLLMRESVEKNRKLADIVLFPDLDGLANTDYQQMAAIMARGTEEAERRLAELKNLVAGIPPHTVPLPTAREPVIDSLAFEGLEAVPPDNLKREVKVRPGEPLDIETLKEDFRRLYATRLFDSIDAELHPVGQNRYQLNYLLKEAPLQTLGASVRYDKEYRLVALAEFTARQLFHSPSTLTVSGQFGGFENFQAGLRYIAPPIPFLFIEPKVHYRRRERLDIRNGDLADRFLDKRWGGQIMFGGSFFKRLEVEMGWRSDRVTIGGGTEPNKQDGTLQLAGLTLRLKRDTLDLQEFARSGMTFRFQIDKRSEDLGGDVSYSKWQGDLHQYLSPTDRSTLHLRASGGYSQGDMPFYDRFYIGGFNFAEGAPRHLLGYRRDELSSRQMGLLGTSFRWRLFSNPLSFAKRGFIIAHYNVAAFSDAVVRPYDFKVFHGGGLGFALDTLFGPMQIAGGWGERGRFNFYLTLGPAF